MKSSPFMQTMVRRAPPSAGTLQHLSTQTSLVTGVDFTMLPTRDFDAAVEFYGTVPGLPCTKRYGHG